MDSQFDKFWTIFTSCQYEIPDEMKAEIKKAMEAAGFFTINNEKSNQVGVAAPVASSTGKKLTGYNLYMKEKSHELKEQNVPGGERMTKIGAMWKALSKDEQIEWKVKAGGTSGKSSGLAGGAKKSLNGYQLYLRETMPEIKADTSIHHTQRMTKIGEKWKALEKSEREEWSKKAKESD
jgi:hypothetical protein